MEFLLSLSIEVNLRLSRKKHNLLFHFFSLSIFIPLAIGVGNLINSGIRLPAPGTLKTFRLDPNPQVLGIQIIFIVMGVFTVSLLAADGLGMKSREIRLIQAVDTVATFIVVGPISIFFLMMPIYSLVGLMSSPKSFSRFFGGCLILLSAALVIFAVRQYKKLASYNSGYLDSSQNIPEFIPEDPFKFSIVRNTLWLFFFYPIFVKIVLFLTWTSAGGILGIAPIPSVHDPKQIHWIVDLGCLIVFTLLLGLPVIFFWGFGLILAEGQKWKNEEVASLKLVVLYILCWLIGILLLRWNLWQMWDWYWD